MPTGFWVGLALFLSMVVGLLLLTKYASRASRFEEHEAFERRQKEAILKDQERADEITKKANEAARVPTTGSLADRLRGTGRSRTP